MNVEIAQRLAARRKQAGLSQEALAERLGVSRQAVSKWERSESSPDTDNLIALAQLYGLSLDDLLYVDDEIRDDVTFEAACRAAERLDAAKAGSGAPQVPCTSGTLRPPPSARARRASRVRCAAQESARARQIPRARAQRALGTPLTATQRRIRHFLRKAPQTPRPHSPRSR